MKIKKLFHTVKDKENPDYIEENAPFICRAENAWLGDGYYFWDTFIENAHWWGTMRHGELYVICKGECDFDTDKCFDLVGDTEHMEEFDSAIQLLKSKGLVKDDTTVARVIEFIKRNATFNFEAIRVYGIKSISEYKEEYSEYRHRLIFEVSKKQYLDYKPAIQLCLFKPNSLNLRNIVIEFPDKYNNNMVY